MTALAHILDRRSAWLVGLAAGALLAAPAGAAPVPAPAVRISLRAEAEATGPQVRLGDVATIEVLDLPTLERLVSLPIAPAPRAGGVVHVDRDRLLRWVGAHTGLGEDQIAWTGADVVTVRTAAAVVPGSAIVERAAAALRRALEEGGIHAEIEATRVPNDVDVPAGSLQLRVRNLLLSAASSRRQAVWVDVWVEGRFVRSVPVAFEVTAQGAAAVAAVRPRLVEAEMVLPAPRGGSAPLVRRGGWATLRASAGLVSLEGRVRVLEDGCAGQTVRVRSAGADGPVLARVSGPGVVEALP